uniref:Secreted protein n=1 Tax=Fagus sylvatica TaxID=28930 RepID=A0A2N9HWT5_FAGSY
MPSTAKPSATFFVVHHLCTSAWGFAQTYLCTSAWGGDGGLGEIPGGGAEVVANKEGGGGLGSGRHHFGDGFCWRKMWLIEKK